MAQAKLTLFHGMLLLQGWLDFLHLFGEEVYLPLEKVLGILSCLQGQSEWLRGGPMLYSSSSPKLPVPAQRGIHVVTSTHLFYIVACSHIDEDMFHIM